MGFRRQIQTSAMNLVVKLLALLLLPKYVFPIYKDSKWDYYCDKSITKCKHGVHTVCLRDYKCGPLKNCTQTVLSNENKKWILHTHNTIRNLVANGTEKRGLLENHQGVKDMNVMNWDNELEFVMACHLNRCWYKHDECRDVKRFCVGQNLGQSVSKNKYIGKSVLEILKTLVWAHFYNIEIEHIKDPNLIDRFYLGDAEDGSQRIGHYTQLVWGQTKWIGCSYHSVFQNISIDGYAHYFFGCNYGPCGNVLNAPIYTRGQSGEGPGSMCKIKNEKYNALCGKSLPIPISSRQNCVSPNLSIVIELFITFEFFKIKY